MPTQETRSQVDDCKIRRCRKGSQVFFRASSRLLIRRPPKSFLCVNVYALHFGEPAEWPSGLQVDRRSIPLQFPEGSSAASHNLSPTESNRVPRRALPSSGRGAPPLWLSACSRRKSPPRPHEPPETRLSYSVPSDLFIVPCVGPTGTERMRANCGFLRHGTPPPPARAAFLQAFGRVGA